MHKGSQPLADQLHQLRICGKFVALADLESVSDGDVEIGCCAFQQLLCAQAIA